MTYQEINTMIDNLQIPSAYYQFTADTAVPPPFICFFYEGSDDFTADNKNYTKIRPLNIELYTETKDFDLESRVEEMLNNNGFVYEREETPIDSERLYMVVFRTTAIITEVEDG